MGSGLLLIEEEARKNSAEMFNKSPKAKCGLAGQYKTSENADCVLLLRTSLDAQEKAERQEEKQKNVFIMARAWEREYLTLWKRHKKTPRSLSHSK